MNTIPFLFLLLLSACSTRIYTPASRMISPEAQGKFLKGSFDGRFQGTKSEKIDLTSNTVERPFTKGRGAHEMAGDLELGLFPIADLILFVPTRSTIGALVGAKVQLLGKPRSEAKSGNFSASLYGAYGSGEDELEGNSDVNGDRESNFNDGEFETSHEELGLLTGYRWSDSLLHYASAVNFHQRMKGSLTSDDKVLVDALFKTAQTGMLYSSGLVWSFGPELQLKLDFSHLVSGWSYDRKSSINSVSGGVGVHW